MAEIETEVSQHIPGGEIQVIYGPMFAGKTTELQRRIQRYRLARRECAIIKYSHDTRYSEDCCTHDLRTYAAIATTKLFDIADQITKMDVIGIDEGQFFPDIVDFSETMANQGKIVIIACLDATFQRKPFNDILDLIPKAEKVDKLTAICAICGKDAAFSKRISSDTQVELIGGSEHYISSCRTCFFKPLDSETAHRLNEFNRLVTPPASPVKTSPEKIQDQSNSDNNRPSKPENSTNTDRRASEDTPQAAVLFPTTNTVNHTNTSTD